MADKMSIDNKPVEPSNSSNREESDESIDSPSDERDQIFDLPSGGPLTAQELGQQPKRKGGRKPVSL